MGFLRKLFIKCDLLVQPYSMKTDQKQHNKTLLGGILTLILIIFSGVYFMSVFLSYRTDEQIIYAGTQKEDTNTNQTSSLDQKTLFFILEINQYKENLGLANNIFLNQSKYLSINSSLVEQRRSKNSQGFERNKKKFNFKQCTSSYIDQFNFFTSIFSKDQKNQLICPSDDFELYGSFFDEKYNYLEIRISKCSNETQTEIECAPKDEINNYINEGYSKLLFKNINRINVDLFLLESRIKKQLNLSHPGEQKFQEVFWRLTPDIQNNEDIYLSPITLESQNEEFFSVFKADKDKQKNKLIYRGIEVSKQERRTSFVYDDELELAVFYIRVDSDQKYFFTNESNILSIFLDSVSQVAGLMIAIASFLSFIYKFYNHHKLFETLMNQAFYFDLQEKNQCTKFKVKENKQINLDKSKTLERVLNYHIEYSFLSYLKYKTLKLLKKLKIIKESFFQYVQIQILINSQLYNNIKILLAQQVKQKIQDDLNYVNILKKLYEIDCLKLFLLDEEQLILFNHFCRPVMNEDIINQKLYKNSFSLQKMPSVDEKGSPQSKKNKINFLVNSKIPQSYKLAKVNPFFNSQVIEKNPEVVWQKYQKLINYKNINSEQNKKLFNFMDYNKKLYELIQNHKKKSSLQIKMNIQEDNQIFANIHFNTNKPQTEENKINEDLQINIGEDGYSFQNIKHSEEEEDNEFNLPSPPKLQKMKSIALKNQESFELKKINEEIPNNQQSNFNSSKQQGNDQNSE